MILSQEKFPYFLNILNIFDAQLRARRVSITSAEIALVIGREKAPEKIGPRS
jgi:hypothetical protein